MKRLLLGVDLGTGGCKVIAIDAIGNTAAQASQEYKTLHPQSGWAEQSPADWLAAAASCIKSVVSEVGASNVAAIGVTAPTHNAVLLDDRGIPVRNSIIWTDQRSASIAAALGSSNPEIFRKTWQAPSPTWTLPQLMWLRSHEPGAFSKASNILFGKDYVRYWLTGKYNTDRVDAQGSMLVDMAAGEWAKDLCDLVPLAASMLPQIIEPTAIAGYVTEKAAAVTGLLAGTPVIAGTSDTAAECFGAGVHSCGLGVVKLATAGTICIFSETATPNPKALTYGHVVPGLWYNCLATNSAAHSVRWFRDTFLSAERHAYQRIDLDVQSVRPGAEGLLYHPYLMGERSPHWNPDLCASFTGVRAHHTRGHFARAVMEGVAFSLRDCLGAYTGAEPPTAWRLIGGGAESKVWPQIIANILDRSVQCVASGSAAFGVALLAGVGLGPFSSFEEAVQVGVSLTRTFEPQPIYRNRYRSYYEYYRSVQEKLAPAYAELSDMRRKAEELQGEKID
jgi:xylulokinase